MAFSVSSFESTTRYTRGKAGTLFRLLLFLPCPTTTLSLRTSLGLLRYGPPRSYPSGISDVPSNVLSLQQRPQGRTTCIDNPLSGRLTAIVLEA